MGKLSAEEADRERKSGRGPARCPSPLTGSFLRVPGQEPTQKARSQPQQGTHRRHRMTGAALADRAWEQGPSPSPAT